MRPNLDGADFAFADRIGQAAKADVISCEGVYAQKAMVAQKPRNNDHA